MAPTLAHTEQAGTGDDWLTLAALGVLAFAVADVSHEALGHGLANWAVGGRAVLLTTCNFDASGPYSKWIPAGGGLMNVAVGVGSLLLGRFVPQRAANLRYLLVLVAAFNLFFASGYPVYSGIFGFGDWAAVTSGLQPQWLWRVLLVAAGVAAYFASMRLVARAIAPFGRLIGTPTDGLPNKGRLRRWTMIPYVASMVMACMAGALNPKGSLTMLTAGLPAAAASFGLTQMDHLVAPAGAEASHVGMATLQRRWSWVTLAAVVLVFFVAVLGPGIRF